MKQKLVLISSILSLGYILRRPVMTGTSASGLSFSGAYAAATGNCKRVSCNLSRERREDARP